MVVLRHRVPADHVPFLLSPDSHFFPQPLSLSLCVCVCVLLLLHSYYTLITTH